MTLRVWWRVAGHQRHNCLTKNIHRHVRFLFNFRADKYCDVSQRASDNARGIKTQETDAGNHLNYISLYVTGIFYYLFQVEEETTEEEKKFRTLTCGFRHQSLAGNKCLQKEWKKNEETKEILYKRRKVRMKNNLWLMNKTWKRLNRSLWRFMRLKSLTLPTVTTSNKHLLSFTCFVNITKYLYL